MNNQVKTLAIISHTEHFLDKNGNVVGWGATIREINHLTEIFDTIYHVAPLHEGIPPSSSLPYSSEKIQFVALKPSGGDKLSEKMSILKNMCSNLRIIRKTLKKADCFQFRAPTGIGIYVIPYLVFVSNKKGWFKYAGNWCVTNTMPLANRIQRFLLKYFTKRIVTINGKWHNQPTHILTFENPCLTKSETEAGKECILQKDYSEKLNFIFIGRLEDAKGVQRIIDAFASIKNEKIGEIHFVGDGAKREQYQKEWNEKIKYPAIFHGFLKKPDICKLLASSHVHLLPSNSEGFPKVVAEAFNFGCINIVSDVSCISQYVLNDENGIVMEYVNVECLKNSVNKVLSYNPEKLKCFAVEGYRQTEKFTYEYYNQRIKNEIINVTTENTHK